MRTQHNFSHCDSFATYNLQPRSAGQSHHRADPSPGGGMEEEEEEEALGIPYVVRECYERSGIRQFMSSDYYTDTMRVGGSVWREIGQEGLLKRGG